ncbi:hypothetical protein [uncultured Roseobacter sp.]|uniref:hypothetical protein n=1 Tax=uncultured Roseobacter sp. TaxID=114847 RepID=UPI002619C497|nr:hypothetical protein [uncultured Roseobacter sp.]
MEDLPEGFEPPDNNRLYPALFELHREIHELSKDLNNLARLLDIQKKLVFSVMEAEEEIRQAKAEKRDPTEWQYLRYNFLCLGDCLVFLYIDRFALKQTFFNVNNENPKQSGGFLSGKAGLAAELTVLKDAISHNVPAVLCDLTNVFRYGDICLLCANDPVPIEVKSSKNKDARGKRQKKKLETLTNFFENDQAENLRGFEGTTYRIAFLAEPESFGGLLATALTEAKKNGSAFFEVDGCLRFLIKTTDGVEKSELDVLFDGVEPSRSLCNFVNQLKSNMLWGCYLPYALTLSEPDHYAMFVRGEISIVSMLDLNAFDRKFSVDGVKVEIEATEDVLQCKINFEDLATDQGTPFFIVGDHMMNRMWFDFLLPSWIVQNSRDVMESNPRFLEAQEVVD